MAFTKPYYLEILCDIIQKCITNELHLVLDPGARGCEQDNAFFSTTHFGCSWLCSPKWRGIQTKTFTGHGSPKPPLVCNGRTGMIYFPKVAVEILGRSLVQLDSHVQANTNHFRDQKGACWKERVKPKRSPKWLATGRVCWRPNQMSPTSVKTWNRGCWLTLFRRILTCQKVHGNSFCVAHIVWASRY